MRTIPKPFCLHCAVLDLIKKHRDELDPEETIFRLTEVIGDIINAQSDEVKMSAISYSINSLMKCIGGEIVGLEYVDVDAAGTKH